MNILPNTLKWSVSLAVVCVLAALLTATRPTQAQDAAQVGRPAFGLATELL